MNNQHKAFLLSVLLFSAGNVLGDPPIVTQQPASQIVDMGSNMTFSIAVGGTGPFICQWLSNGTNIPDEAIITTVAGNGNGGYSGDGGPATNASFNNPRGIGVDSSGNVYIADKSNNRIRKMDTNGLITTIAGNGNAGYSGDGAAATNASLNYPWAVTVDSSKNAYIADIGNNRIRKVDSNGVITTIAGNGSGGYSGDGVAATNASLSDPSGVAVDSSGNIYISDDYNSRIRMVDTNGVITTVAGNGNAAFSGDGGSATNASINYPYGIAVDSSVNIYIADLGNARIRKVDANGIITTVAGNGTAGNSGDGGAATNASFYYAYGVAVDFAGNLYIDDYASRRIRKVDFNGGITTVAGNYNVGYSGDGGAAINASLNYPQAVAVDSSGALYIADTGNSRIRKVTDSNPPTKMLAGVTAAEAGSYSIIVTSPYGSVTSAVATLTVVNPLQPANQAVNIGNNASFSVAVNGIGPFNYQWQFDGANINQPSLQTLTLTNVTAAEAGSYSAIVTCPSGSLTTAVATLTVVNPPQPSSQIVDSGGSATFSVTAIGTGPFSYQWQLNGTNPPNNSIITTVVGNGQGSYSGDGGTATNASLYEPEGVALDSSGNLYIADGGNHRIRKVGINGIITTVAGNGSSAYSGDGGAAVNSSLNSPQGVAVDSLENIYIADTLNNRIRKVNFQGIITTVAGNGNYGYSGDGGSATNAILARPDGVIVDFSGNIFIADSDNGRIRKVDSNGNITTIAGGGSANPGNGGAATNARIGPTGLALDSSGNLYIADFGFNRIRKVDTNGIITTVAGTGSFGYSGDGGAATNATVSSPYDVALDFLGNLYITDGNNVIREVNSQGVITTVAGNKKGYGYSGDGGPATNATFFPLGVAVDSTGNIYISDNNNNRIRKVTEFNQPTLTLTGMTAAQAGNYSVIVTSPAGSVTSAVATLLVISQPQSTSQIVDAGSSVTRSVSTSQTGTFSYQWQFNGTNPPNNSIITTVAGNGQGGYSGDGGAATNANLNQPWVVAVDAFGNYYIPDKYNNRVRKVDTKGVITTAAGNGNDIYSGDGGAATNASLHYPVDVALDSSGNFYIADSLNNCIRKVGTNGIITTVAGNGTRAFSGDGDAATNASLYYPFGVSVDSLGNFYIADEFNQRIRKVGTNGIITTVAGNGNQGNSGDGGAATNGALNIPTGVAVDSSGNLYIADLANSRVRKVDINGMITTVAGIGSNGGGYGYSGDGGSAISAALNNPNGVAVDSLGNIYISDTGNNRIRKVNSQGIITTIAGGGGGGDGGTATNASLNQPFGVTVDSSGNLYISDSSNNRIRKVTEFNQPTLTLNGLTASQAGSYSVVVTGSSGSVTSAVATLTVVSPPLISVSQYSINQNTITFGIPTANGASYTVQAASDPTATNWVYYTNFTGNGSSIPLTVPIIPNGYQFFRVRTP